MRKKQFEPLIIHDYSEKVFHLPNHSHTYYELIYIHSGSGLHCLNKLHFPYQSGDLFMISPDDEHYFDIKEMTHFTFIKFTDTYFQEMEHFSSFHSFPFHPVAIMRNKMLKESKLKIGEPCASILQNTVNNIVAYNCKKDISISDIVYFQILSIFALIKEAMTNQSIWLNGNELDKESLIGYINQNIYSPSKVQIKHISAHFNIASNYFSAYFKRKFDLTYREYIKRYRTKLIEKRIESGKYSLKQIADEFGFTDASHLSHFFKDVKRITPVAYGKQKIVHNK